MLRLFVIVIALGLSANAWAQSQKTDIRPNANRVVGDALLNSFMGVTHEGAYNFTDDGEPTRYYAETHHKSGKTTYIEGDINTVGAWIIRKEVLCFVYPDIDMSGGCFRVYQVGNCYYYYNDAIPEFDDELDRNYWTARSVKRGERPNCEPNVS